MQLPKLPFLLVILVSLRCLLCELIGSQLTPQSYTINNVTQYTWVIYRNINPSSNQFIVPTTLPSTAYVQLKFSTSYASVATTTLACSNQFATIACSITGRLLTITGLFSDSRNRASDTLTIIISGIKNPYRAEPCGNFEYYIKSSSGTTIDSSPLASQLYYSTSITFIASTFASCQISANSNYISTRSRLTFTIKTKNPIPSDGQLVINIPSSWDYDLLQNITVASTPTCTPVSGLGVPSCSYTIISSPINLARITVSSLSTTGVSEGATFVIDVSSILTPPYVNHPGRISLNSQWSDGIQIDSCTSKILSTIPIPFRTVISTLQSGTSEVQSKFTQKLSLTLSKSFSSSDQITLLVPNNYLTNSQISISLSNYGLFTTTIQPSTNNTKQTQVRLSNFPAVPSIISENNAFNVFFNNVYNFQSVEPQNIVITFYRQSEMYQLSTFEIVATIGQFTSVEVVPDSGVVGVNGPGTITVNSQYKISTGAVLQIQYNSAITASDVAQTAVISASRSGNSTSNVKYSTSQNIITITNLFQSTYSGGIIQVKIGKLTNPPNTKPTPYTITIFSSTGYAIASASFTFTASLQVFKSVSATLTSSSYKVLDTSVTYTIAFQTYYGFKSVSIIVPADVKVETGFETTCSPSTYASCQIQQVGTGWVRNITFVGVMPAGTQKISWGANVNPSSLKTTASFNMYTYDNGWGVEKSSGIISLTMTQLNTLLSVQALPSSYQNDATISLQLSYILPGLTPTGTLIFTLPSVLDLTSSSCSFPSNISSCTIIKPNIRISFTSTNTARDTTLTYSYSITLNNVRNAPSLKPISNIGVLYTSSQSYDSLAYSAAAWTNTILSTFTTTVSSDVGYRGENAVFNFGLSGLSGKQTYVNIKINTNFINLITAPTSATLISGYQVRYNIFGQANTQKSFTHEVPVSIGEYTFALRTYTSDDYLMGQSTSNIWKQSCYGTQCRACTGALCLNCYNNSLTLYYFYNTADSTCIRGCNPGQYKQTASNTCTPCNANCQQCSTSATTCTVCHATPTLYYLNIVTLTCVLDCPTAYYKNAANQKCAPCVSPCYNCQDDMVCISCLSGYYYLTSTKQCVDNCPSGVMVNNLVNRTCDLCSTNCLTCQTYTYNCLTCNNTAGLYLQSNTCVPACSSQKFLVDKICTQCQSPCRICHNSTTVCSTCDSTTATPLWYDYRCITAEQCVIGHFVNSVNSSCDACPTECLVCVSLTNCSSCALGFYLYGNKCISACPNVTYKVDNPARICTACVGCVTCTSQTVCTSCKSTQFLYLETCYSVCPNGTYASSQTVSTGPRSICVLCPTNCLTCSNSTYCLSCLTQKNLYLGTCYQTCPSKTFPSPPICKDCPTSCSTCQSLTTCLTCAPTYSLENSQCVLNCQVGISENQVCLPCGLNCSICNVTSAQCQICNTGYSLYRFACVATCPVGMFSNNKECLNCLDFFVNCSTCSVSQCFTCLEGELKNGSCVPCNTGYYTMNSKCVVCPSQCTICTSPTSCSSCSSGFYTQANFCVSQCPLNKFPNGTKCDVCIQNCQKCNLQIPGSCTLCIAGMLMFEGYCVSVCPQPFVKNLNTTLCITQQAYSLQYSKSSKPIYFPFSIAIVVVIAIGIILKLYVKQMHIITFLVAVGAWIELASWVLFGVIQYLFYTNLQTNAGIGVILVLAALGALVFANLVFLRLYCKYFVDDIDFVKWENKHSCINKVFVVLGACFNFKAHRMLYSKVMDRQQLSLVLSSPKKLIPISILSFVSIVLSSGSIIVACGLAIYNSLSQDQQFFNALDTLVITSIIVILMLMDLKHGHSYFIDEHETKNIKNKMFDEDYEEFSINGNKKSKDKYKVQDFQKGSDFSRENLVEGAGEGGIMDNLITAKKFRANKNNQKLGEFNETMRENSQTGTKLKQVSNSQLQQLNSMNNLLAPPSNQNQYIDEPQDESLPQQKWIQKQYDAHGYLIKRDALNNPIRYDENGYRVEIDENGKHHKYNSEGYEMLFNKQKGIYEKFDNEGFRVGDNGDRFDRRGYRVVKGQDAKLRFYDENGYEVVKDQQGNQIKIDQHGNQVKFDQKTGTFKPYNKDGHQIIYGKDSKQNLYKNSEGQYVRYNPLTKQWQQYDPQDNFSLRKNPQTGEYQKYDQHGFRVQKDQYGKLYRYDADNNRVTIDSNGKIHRYNSEGYQIIQDPITGQKNLYDKDGYLVKIDPITKAKTFYDKHGYRVERDFYGKVTLYDKQGNMVIIDPITKKHRKFNKEGLEIVDDGNGNTYLRDKRGRKVVELQGGYYEKYDEVGNKVWLDQEGYEVQTDQDGNVSKYDKVGDLVDEDQDVQQNGEWQIEEDAGDNAASLKKQPKKPRLKFKQTKQYNFQQEYEKMVTQTPNILTFDQESVDDNLRQFHDVQPVPEYELEKQYQTLYNMETENEFMKRDNSENKIKLEDLDDIDNTPYTNIKERNRKKNQSGNLGQDNQQLYDEERVIDPQIKQDKHEVKSVADASIDQRSFDNEGVQPITQDYQQKDDDLDSIQEIDAGAMNKRMKKNKKRRSQAVLQQNNISKVTQNRSQNNYVANKSQQKKQQPRKIYDSDDEVNSLEQQQWQNQPAADIFYKDNPNTNTNTHPDRPTDLEEQSDILSDYIPTHQESDRNHKASEENILHKKYMQSIEEVQDQLFEKLKSEDNRKVKRTDFKLSGTPNPLVQYAKTIDVKKMQEERSRRKDRYADGGKGRR